MATDDERRLAAERLREYGARPYPNFNIALILCAMGIDLIEHLERRHGDSELFDRLADLIEPTCDREALLALAKEMDRDGRIQRERQKDGQRWFIDGLDIRDYARRIREACGEVDK